MDINAKVIFFNIVRYRIFPISIYVFGMFFVVTKYNNIARVSFFDFSIVVFFFSILTSLSFFMKTKDKLNLKDGTIYFNNRLIEKILQNKK